MGAREELVGTIMLRAAEYDPRAIRGIAWALGVVVTHEPHLYEPIKRVLDQQPVRERGPRP